MVSVPHSGTRTLVRHLYGGGTWKHFGNCADLLHRGYAHLHIPVRNPLDVARSWAQRNKTGDVLRNMLGRYAEMFETLADYGGDITLYRIEDLAALAGTGEHPGAPADSSRIREFQAAVRDQVIAPHRDYFLSFYNEDALA